MSERTAIHRASTNGHTPAEVDGDPRTTAEAGRRGLASIIVPIMLIVTALFVMRRMRHGRDA
jgi:hypothetical protein